MRFVHVLGFYLVSLFCTACACFFLSLHVCLEKPNSFALGYYPQTHEFKLEKRLWHTHRRKKERRRTKHILRRKKAILATNSNKKYKHKAQLSATTGQFQHMHHMQEYGPCIRIYFGWNGCYRWFCFIVAGSGCVRTGKKLREKKKQ